VQRFLRKYTRERSNARDLQNLNRAADQLNAEAAEALAYQSLDPPSE